MDRRLEAVLAIAASILLLPIGIVVAGTVRVLLGSPVFFKQARAGLNGAPFEMIKFRSMTDLTDDRGALLPDEVRTPPLGKLLRRLRIDELPEFINVIKGDMALVGPRPLLPNTVAAMGPEGRDRGSVRPGMTGWAQVNGNAKLTQNEKLALDLWYIERRSAWLDLSILVRTAAVVVLGERKNSLNLENARASGTCRRS